MTIAISITSRTTSAVHITITDAMLAPRAKLQPPEPPAARRADLTPSEVDAIFVRLRSLKRQFGRKPNKNELAIALISACILEGFDTRRQIVGALRKLDLDRSHVVLILKSNEGADAGSYLWRRHETGQYSLHDRPDDER